MTNENEYLRQMGRVTKLLIVSGVLNIALLAFFFYWIFREVPPTPYCELKPAEHQEQQVPIAIDHNNHEVIRYFRTLSFEQLVAKLTNTQLVENGYTQRDLALASLVGFYHFDLSRALLGQFQDCQQRTISFGSRSMTLYLGLSDQQYQTIVHFLQTERWPLVSKGLFFLLRKQPIRVDESLADAFFLTHEFLSVEMLFNRSEVPVEKKELLKVLCEGNWQMLSNFTEQQRLSQDLSAARRQWFLLEYIKVKSKAAAYLMLKTDGVFAAKKLDNDHVLMVLNLLDEKTPESEQFALAMLTSPRSDAVWKMASNRLYDYAGEARPGKYQHHAALSRFVSQHHPEVPFTPQQHPDNPLVSKPHPETQYIKIAAAETKEVPKEIPKPALKKPLQRRDRLYVIQEGDSLWKISRLFNVDVELIRQWNRLESDALKPGTPLRIPFD